MVMRKANLAVPLLVILSLATGCASRQVVDINERLVSLEAIAKKAPDATYVVDPPDAISIEFLSELGPPPRTATLRSDGCVTLPYLEDVKVGGLTTLQIREKLEDLYSRYYKDPQILVTVTGYNSKHLYVYGEVGRQGTVPYTGSQTVADVIGSVGGFTMRAAPTRVRVIRGDVEDPDIYTVNLRRLLYKGDVRQDVSLAENDVVRVPPNVLAWVGYQIDNLLFPFRSVLSALTTSQALGGPTPAP